MNMLGHDHIADYNEAVGRHVALRLCGGRRDGEAAAGTGEVNEIDEAQGICSEESREPGSVSGGRLRLLGRVCDSGGCLVHHSGGVYTGEDDDFDRDGERKVCEISRDVGAAVGEDGRARVSNRWELKSPTLEEKRGFVFLQAER